MFHQTLRYEKEIHVFDILSMCKQKKGYESQNWYFLFTIITRQSTNNFLLRCLYELI